MVDMTDLTILEVLTIVLWSLIIAVLSFIILNEYYLRIKNNREFEIHQITGSEIAFFLSSALCFVSGMLLYPISPSLFGDIFSLFLFIFGVVLVHWAILLVTDVAHEPDQISQ